MAFAALSVLLVALGVAHASEDCTDIDFFLSISAQEVSCAMQKSAGQCGCYVYAGENGTSNWVNASTVREPHQGLPRTRLGPPHAAPDARPAHGRAHALSSCAPRR